jgi:PII-like signaling protein
MLRPGPAKRVAIHINEDTSSDHDFLYREIFNFLLAHDVAGASLIRPSAGFGSHRRLHEMSGAGAESQHLPVRIEFIETAEKLAEILPELCRLTSDGLIEAQDTVILKSASHQEPA